MALQESGEMYLETIYVLSKGGKEVHSIDVGEHMGYSKPSVSRAISLLKEKGFVITDEEGCLLLTPAGREVAAKIHERHTLLTRLFIKLGVPEEIAADDACKMEHVISDQTFEALKAFLLKE